MPHISYSNNASFDLIRIFSFLAEKDPATAKRAIKEIRDALSPLEKMPKIGRTIQENLRELVIDFGNSGYIALYQLDELLDEVVVLAIRHQLENDYAMKK
jgi:plasmid stabilization system protein ParE